MKTVLQRISDIRTLFCGCAALLFFSFSASASLPGGLWLAGVFALTYFLFGLLLVWQDPTDSLPGFCVMLAAVGALLCARLVFFDHTSHDYQVFLSDWVFRMRSLPGLSPLTTPIGDYNMPYLYFLFGVARSGLNPLFCIKFLSVLFDLTLAFFAMKLVGFGNRRWAPAVGLVLTLAVPTVLLNSAAWAQCDSIYAALCLAGLFFALKERSALSIALFAIAFSVKIQTIFILPILLALLLARKIKWRDAWVFPSVFLSLLLPAVLAGRPIADTVSIYFKQVGQYESLTLNAPTLWSFAGDAAPFEFLNLIAILLAGCVVLGLCYLVFTLRRALTPALIITFAFAFCLAMPYFLPRMHERYFYLAEILSVVYFLLNTRKWYYPVVLIGTTFSTYVNYLFGGQDYLTLPMGAAALLVLLILLVRDIVLSPKTSETEATVL